MEFFGARADEPIETCLAEVRKSDILVVIVGHQYGSLVPKKSISYSEAEYCEGFRLGKTCLVYMRGDNVPIPPMYMECDPDKLRLLKKWKATLQDRHTVVFFENDLAVKVTEDISRVIKDLEEGARTAQAETPIHLHEEVKTLVVNAINKGVGEELLLSSIRQAVSTVVSEMEHVKATVFLSYATSDRHVVCAVANRLQATGIRVWFDETSLNLGDNWVREIGRGLDTADFIVFFISPNSVSSSWALKEIQFAMYRKVSGSRGARILPILLEHAEVPPLLRDIQWLDMTDGDIEKAVKQLVKTIHHFQGVKNVV
jgi:hypothetical protein